MNEKKPRWESQKGGIYLDTVTKKYYHRPRINGKPTFRVLDVATLTQARALKAKLDSSQTMHEHGLAKDPYGALPVSVGELLEAFKKEGCPGKNGQRRTGTQFSQELSRLKYLEPFWKHRRADQVKPRDCKDYFASRKANMRRGFSGTRAVDMELTTLTGVFKWAVNEGKLDINPLVQRQKFRDGKTVKHCRNFMPRDVAELHNLARALFENPSSEALGWQLLLEAMTGCRTSEILRLRWDAQNKDQAGFIADGHLYLERSKQGINEFTEIHPFLGQTLEALQRWRIGRKLTSPWFIPGWDNPGQPVAKCSLTQALRRIGPRIAKEKRTSHGLRAFYVTVRRSQLVSDGQIAAEIGDATGAAIIASTYGGVPEIWKRKDAKAMDWTVPEPAWTVLDLPQNVVQLPAAVG